MECEHDTHCAGLILIRFNLLIIALHQAPIISRFRLKVNVGIHSQIRGGSKKSRAVSLIIYILKFFLRRNSSNFW